MLKWNASNETHGSGSNLYLCTTCRCTLLPSTLNYDATYFLFASLTCPLYSCTHTAPFDSTHSLFLSPVMFISRPVTVERCLRYNSNTKSVWVCVTVRCVWGSVSSSTDKDAALQGSGLEWGCLVHFRWEWMYVCVCVGRWFWGRLCVTSTVDDPCLSHLRFLRISPPFVISCFMICCFILLSCQLVTSFVCPKCLMCG